jgi:hypothetical protein
LRMEWMGQTVMGANGRGDGGGGQIHGVKEALGLPCRWPADLLFVGGECLVQLSSGNDSPGPAFCTRPGLGMPCTMCPAVL